MKKWEVKYNELKNGKLDQDIQQLKQKVEQKSATREEYKQYNKLLKIKDNMPKVANIVEYKEEISKNIAKIQKELEVLKTIKESETFETLDIKMNKISEERLNIQKQLKNKKLTKDQKEDLLKRGKQLDKEMDDNNKKYVKLQNILKSQKQNVSREELENKKNELLQKRSKCNLVGRNLVEGLSWNSIEMNLDKWKDKTFTAKKAEIKDDEKSETKTGETYTREEQGENLPAKVGIFTKIKNKISNLVKNIFKSRNKEDIETENNEVIKTQRDDFTKYLREVAEKGYKEINREQAMKKREELKKEAYKREAERYGEEYAKRSKTQADDER